MIKLMMIVRLFLQKKFEVQINMCSKFTSNIRPKWLLWVIIIFKNKWLINIYFSLSSLTKSKFLNKWMKEIKHAGISYISYVGYNIMHACDISSSLLSSSSSSPLSPPFSHYYSNFKFNSFQWWWRQWWRTIVQCHC